MFVVYNLLNFEASKIKIGVKFRKCVYLQHGFAVAMILPQTGTLRITRSVRGWACGSAHLFSPKFLSNSFIFALLQTTHDRFRYIVEGETLQHKKDGIAMKKQLAESIILNLLSFTADQMKAFLSHEDVAGKLDASLLARLCQSPEDLLQKDQ